MRKNSNLNDAKRNKKDEFYTQFETIEKEIKYHENSFRNKVVLCNCDNPGTSAFWKYFHLNFSKLGIKKLISTYYNEITNPSKMIYQGGNDTDILDGEIQSLNGNGDFRSEECIDILRNCDIVITNPPFSLFRDYIDILIKYDKQFLILGNINTITHKPLFGLIKENKIWLGNSITCGDIKFTVPQDYPLEAYGCGIDSNGNKYIKVTGVRWFTNLESTKQKDLLPLRKSYFLNTYQKYDNYDAININKTKDIPYDYDGVMGVPITFLDKYNPKQFEIVGITIKGETGIVCKDNSYNPKVNGKSLYKRIFIRKII